MLVPCACSAAGPPSMLLPGCMEGGFLRQYVSTSESDACPIGSIWVPRTGRGNLWQYLGPRNGVPFRPHSQSQLDMLSRVAIPWPGRGPSVYTGCCGRRYGKTTSLEVLCWHGFTAPEDIFGPPVVRLTADTFEHGQKVWDRFVWHAENTPLKSLIKSHDRSRKLITGLRGETIQLLSADNPAALAGDGVTLWAIDESQYLTFPAFENLFPSTAERDGVIVMYGVAEGDGPFREQCYRGMNAGDYPENCHFELPTSANPFVPRRRIDLARRVYTPERFSQLYLGKWADSTGRIFRGVEQCVGGPSPVMHPKGWAYCYPRSVGMQYYGGLDLAKFSDWCVYTIFDKHGRMVAWDRFNRTSWELLKFRVRLLSREYGNPTTYVDSTGVGDPIYEDLLRMGMNCEGYSISGNELKKKLIDGLAVRIGSKEIEYPRNRIMMEELTRYEAVKSRTPGSNVIQYQAPAGFHDDFVVSIALAMYGMPRQIPVVYKEMLMAAGPDDEELRQIALDGYVFGSDGGVPGSESEYIPEGYSMTGENVLRRPMSEADYL